MSHLTQNRLDHFGDEFFQATDRIGTDNQRTNKQNTTLTKNIKK